MPLNTYLDKPIFVFHEAAAAIQCFNIDIPPISGDQLNGPLKVNSTLITTEFSATWNIEFLWKFYVIF